MSDLVHIPVIRPFRSGIPRECPEIPKSDIRHASGYVSKAAEEDISAMPSAWPITAKSGNSPGLKISPPGRCSSKNGISQFSSLKEVTLTTSVRPIFGHALCFVDVHFLKYRTV